MTLLDKFFGLLIAFGFLAIGVACVLFPKAIQRRAQAQRPPNWGRIPGLNIIWAWIDDPTYVPIISFIGVVSMGTSILVQKGHRSLGCALLVSVLFLLGSIVACSSALPVAPQPPDLQFMDVQSCLTSVQPGESSDDGLISALRACPTVSPKDFKPYLIPGTDAYMYSWQVGQNQSGTAIVRNGQLLWLTYTFGNRLSLQTVLDVNGPPDYVSRGVRSIPEKCVAFFILVYLKLGMNYAIQDFPCEQDIHARSDLNINGYVRYAPNGTVDDMLKNLYLGSEPAIATAKSELRVWQGYDSLKPE